MQIKSYAFGKLKNKDVISYQLIAKNGFQIDILNYGGIIHKILIPDTNGSLTNIVLNYPTLDGYLQNNLYLGCITGRHAGRISNAEFTLNGKTYHLAKNNGEHNLHGGIHALDKKVWNVSLLNDGIKLSYTSPDMEEGFPAEVEFNVSYRIIDDYSLCIEYYAIPKAETIINLTNHTYFNLSGTSNDATTQLLKINADKYCKIDSSGLVTGEVESIINTPFDFRDLKTINQDQDIHQNNQQLQFAHGYDHPFMLRDNKQTPAVTLISPQSKIGLEVYTEEKFVVFYSGNFLTVPRSGICLETQNIPNAINLDWALDKSIYSPDKPYTSSTIWKFAIIK